MPSILLAMSKGRKYLRSKPSADECLWSSMKSDDLVLGGAELNSRSCSNQEEFDWQLSDSDHVKEKILHLPPSKSFGYQNPELTLKFSYRASVVS